MGETASWRSRSDSSFQHLGKAQGDFPGGANEKKS
jgi:hypothetical protein